ncbi:MAG TPA: FAD-dependent oxidoreductase [Thermoplasmata archaeon]|nr:FAD-dependent oxidoreductase [Thermoplasmata archaeon]
MPASKYDCVVTDNFYESPDVYLLRMTFPPEFTFKPGQYVSFEYEKDGAKKLKPYSIASPPHILPEIEFCIKRVDAPVPGFVSNLLKPETTPKGAKFRALGPLGRFILEPPVPHDCIFIATGTGIAPFVAMLGEIFKHGGTDRHIWLFYGVRYENGLVYHALLEMWASQHPTFHYVPTLSRPEPTWKGGHGYVQHHFQKMITEPKEKQVYICGLKPMVEEVITIAQQVGFGKEQIHFEKYV